MADIQIVAEVVGQKKINSLIKSTQTLEGRVKTLSKAYQSGKIGPEQYQQGLTELRKAASKLYPTHQKASAVVTKLSKDYLAASKAQKEYTAAQKQEQAATRAYAQARREATEANARFDAQQRKSAQAAKEAAKEEERLKNKFVQGYTAMNVYTKELNDLAVARKKGIITAEQQRQATARLNQEMESGTGIFSAGALAVQQTGRRTNQLGVLMQQTGYQVGDFAVQVQSGTNVMVALGQQATQLVGTFGMLAKSTKMIGIFAGLGVLIPIATAVAGAFMRMGESAEDSSDKAEKKVRELSQAISSLNDIQKATSEGFKRNLNKEFGESAEKIERLVAAINKVRFAESMEPVEDAVRQIRFGIDAASASMDRLAMISSMSSVEKFFAGVDDADIRRLQQRVQANIELVNAQEKVRASLEAIQSSTTSGELVKNFSQAFDLLENIGGPAAEDMLKSLVEAAKEAGVYEEVMRRAGQETEDTADSAGKIGPALQSAIDQANAFASALGRAANNAASIGISTAGMRAERKALEKGMSQAEATAIAEATTAREKILSTVDRPGPQRDTLAQEEFERTRQAVLERELEKSRLSKVKESLQPDTGGVGGGAGGGKSPAEIAQENLEKLREQLKVEQALIGKSEERKRIIKSLGIEFVNQNPQIVNGLEAQIQQIDEMTQREQQLKSFGETIKNGLGDAFMSIVDGSKSAGDAFKDLARLVIQQAFKMLVIQPILNGIFGAVGGFFGMGVTANANGNAFSNGKVTAFADGGVVNQPTMFPMANGMGLMGEAGPEAIMPLKRGKNGKLGVQVEGGSQQPVVINQSFNFAANGDDSVKKIIAQEAPKIANLTQKQILDQRARGGAFRTTFG